jgi:hypothetical protein
MAAGAGAEAAARAAAAAIAQGIRASGASVRIHPQDFLAILSRNMGALVVQSHGGDSLLQVRVSNILQGADLLY